MSTTTLPADTPTPRRRQRSGAAVAGDLIGGYLPMIIATLAVVLPLVWMIISSFKSPGRLSPGS